MVLARRPYLVKSVSAVALAVLLAVPVTAAAAPETTAEHGPGFALSHALKRLVGQTDGPPGISVVVQRGGARPVLYRAGDADVATGAPFRGRDSMWVASVAKAFSGAVALALVANGTLSLRDTVGKWLPGLPRAWAPVTLRELLQHTSGVPDFSRAKAFRRAVAASPLKAPPPRALLSFAPKRLNFVPGTRYRYSNSDNVIVGLMAQAATGRPYASVLRQQVVMPLHLRRTNLPRGAELPAPFIHGYLVDPPKAPEDVTNAFAAGWAWAAGGVVSTPRELNTFVRAYARGALTSARAHRAQFTFRPGRNSVGLAIFRYQTRCGTVYGHTGNTLGFTQFVGATENGKRSVVVSANAQITPGGNAARFKELRRIYTLAVCAAFDR